MKYEIIRENSKYGNMKWHLVGYYATGGKYSDWYRTEREAKAELARITSQFHIERMEAMCRPNSEK